MTSLSGLIRQQAREFREMVDIKVMMVADTGRKVLWVGLYKNGLRGKCPFCGKNHVHPPGKGYKPPFYALAVPPCDPQCAYEMIKSKFYDCKYEGWFQSGMDNVRPPEGACFIPGCVEEATFVYSGRRFCYGHYAYLDGE